MPSNIAEGNGRQTPGEGIQLLGIAQGSLYEVETQLIIASRLGFSPEEHVREELGRAEEIGRMLHGLIEARRRAKRSGRDT